MLILNLQKITCPRCGEVQPFVRLPNSFRQLMFGGITCAKCGQEMDKWGALMPGDPNNLDG